MIEYTDEKERIMGDCNTCEGTGIGWGKVQGGWLETDCSDCDGSGHEQESV